MNFKKFLFIILAPLLLASCGPNDTSQSGDTTTSEEVHQYSDIYEKDETGHWKVCTVIGHTDKTEKEAHKYGEWKTLSEADVHKDKVEHRHCSVCDYEEKRTVENTGTHTYVLKNDETKHWHESTCDHEVPLKKDEESHTFSDWTTLSEAELHKDKVEHRLCSVCNYEEKRTIDNTGTHTFDSEWKFDKVNHWHESTCGHSPALKNEVAPHVMGEWIEKTPATYTSNRVDERKCTICEYSETRVVEGTMIPKVIRKLELKPIANRTFDGLKKPVLESDLSFDNKEGGLTIEYRKKGSGTYSSSNVPREAGTYEYRVTLGETEMYAKVEKTGEFTIDKLSLDLPNQTLFEVNASSLTIYDFDVDLLTNRYLDYIYIKVPEKYAKPGKYSVPTSELYLDEEESFYLNVGSTVSITVVSYDTKQFIAYISGDVQTISGSSNVDVPITITQGTLENASSIWFYGYGDWLYVREMKQNGTTITKATVGEELSLVVRAPVDTSKLTKGTLLSTKENITTYKSAFATAKIYSSEESGIGSHDSGYIQTIYFEDSLTEHLVKVYYPNRWSNPGSTQEAIRFDFADSIINYIDRPFKLKSYSFSPTGTTFAEGIITSTHNHTDSVNTTGKCEECSFNNSKNLSFAEGEAKAESVVNKDFGNEVRVYYLTLTRSLNYSSKYTFNIDNGAGSSLNSTYTIKLYDANNGAELGLVNNIHTLSSGTSNVDVKIITKRNSATGVSHARLTVTRTLVSG